MVQSMASLSHSTEDYLKAIYELQEDAGKVSTNALAAKLDITAASVTGMLKRLSEEKLRLVNYERHHGVTLTPPGRKIALEIIRHHRLIELYLQQALGYAWDQVDAEAEKLEHVISEELEDRIAVVLGNPTHDPHGDPIPAKDGTISTLPTQKLTSLSVGVAARVARVSDDDPALLRYLAKLGILPQKTLRAVQRSPFDGPLIVQVGNQSRTHALGPAVTDKVYIMVEE